MINNIRNGNYVDILFSVTQSISYRKSIIVTWITNAGLIKKNNSPLITTPDIIEIVRLSLDVSD